jgi:hypothetical protein
MNQRRVTVPVVALAVAVVAVGGAVAAQDGTPTASTPVAGAVACTAEPRDTDEILALWFDPSGAPAVTPTVSPPIADDASPRGRRADEATVAAITETTVGWIACIEVAGQYARGFSFVTDDLLAQFGPDVSNPAQDSPEEIRAALDTQLQATPVAGAEGRRMPALAGPRKVRMMDDGRGAPGGSLGGDKVQLIYELVGDRWLIDEAIDIIEATGTPAATPAATPAS